MAYKKRQLSNEVSKANKRNDGMHSIGTNYDFGNGLTEATYLAEIKKVISLTEKYNTLLSDADGVLTELETAEKSLSELSDRMLSGAGSKYGYDSIEYEKAGGVRKSERKRPTLKNGNKNKV